jgi:hypothetical protein
VCIYFYQRRFCARSNAFTGDKDITRISVAQVSNVCCFIFNIASCDADRLSMFALQQICVGIFEKIAKMEWVGLNEQAKGQLMPLLVSIRCS